MVSEAEYWKVEEHEPVHPRLRAEMSPSPTRLNRRKADGADGQLGRRHPNARVNVGRDAGVRGRMQPDPGIGIDLRNAREKTAIGNLTNTLLSPAYERGKA
jgi:hypothetical protein